MNYDLKDMGIVNLNAHQNAIQTDKYFYINEKINILNKEYNITCFSIINKYGVVFTEDIDSINEIGIHFITNHHFYEKINLIFSKIIDENTIEIKIMEGVNNKPFSIDESACSSAVALILNKYTNNEEIIVYCNNVKYVVIYKNNNHVYIKEKIDIVNQNKRKTKQNIKN